MNNVNNDDNNNSDDKVDLMFRKTKTPASTNKTKQLSIPVLLILVNALPPRTISSVCAQSPLIPRLCGHKEIYPKEKILGKLRIFFTTRRTATIV